MLSARGEGMGSLCNPMGELALAELGDGEVMRCCAFNEGREIVARYFSGVRGKGSHGYPWLGSVTDFKLERICVCVECVIDDHACRRAKFPENTGAAARTQVAFLSSRQLFVFSKRSQPTVPS